MKKLTGGILQVLSFFLCSAGYSIPLAVLSVYGLRKAGVTEGALGIAVAAIAVSALLIVLCSRIPIRTKRALWATVFGLGTYIALGALANFGFAKGTEPVYAGFKIPLENDIMVYIGAALMVVGIVLAAQGRYLVRQSNAATAKIRPIAPKFRAQVEPLPAQRPAPVILTQVPNPILSLDETRDVVRALQIETRNDVAAALAIPREEQAPAAAVRSQAQEPAEEPTVIEVRDVDADGALTGSEVRYMRDKWGNLVAYEDIPPRSELKS